MKVISAFVSLVVLIFGACGHGDDANSELIDAGDGDPDATTDPDAASVECEASADHGIATATDQEASSSHSPENPRVPVLLFLSGSLNADLAPDKFALQMYNGYGVFANGIVPGTYNIAGEELQYATCGLCALIITDWEPTDSPIDSPYLATGGTVTISSVSPNLTGSVAGLTFTEVDIDPETFESTPSTSGCTSAITSLSFDAVVMPFD